MTDDDRAGEASAANRRLGRRAPEDAELARGIVLGDRGAGVTIMRDGDVIRVVIEGGWGPTRREWTVPLKRFEEALHG